MGWLNKLYGKIICLDTAPLIYYIEENPVFIPTIDPFFDAMFRGDFEVVTSTLTLLEVLVHPIRNNNAYLAASYREILSNASHLRTIPVTAEIAEAASRLRAVSKIRTPDAIQVATAIVMGADYFLTNDSELPVLSPPKVLVIGNLQV